MIFGRTACFSVGVANRRMTLRQRVMRASIGPFVLALAQMSVVHPAYAGGHVAMVLVAEDYVGLNHSEVGIKRGSEIAEQLRAHGFDVILKANPTNATARVALRDFSAKISGTDLSLAILIGHGTASGDQTFFLPTNAVIERSTDLRTRGLSIANIANIVSQAGVGGVCFLMTSPRFANPVDGIDMRPHFDVDVAKNIAAAYSNSAKIPVGDIDEVAGLAANEVVDLLQKQPHADLRQLVATCASQQGSVYGSAATVDLAAPVTLTAETQGKDEIARQLEAEKAAQQAADKQAGEAEARTRQAQAEAKANTSSSPPATAQAPSAPVDRVAALCGTGKTDLNGRCIATTRPRERLVNKPGAAPERAKRSASGPAIAASKNDNANGHAFGGRQCAFGIWRIGDECTNREGEVCRVTLNNGWVFSDCHR